MIKHQQKKCIVVTCFDENQPGYLDFSYRITALAKEYQLTVLSHGEITQPELLLKSAQYQSIEKRNGKLGWLRYNIKAARWIRQQKPDVVVLLHSAVSPVAMLIGKIPSCLYWNEHPTNLMRLPTDFSPVRQYLTLFLQQFLFFSARKSAVVMPIGEDHQEDLLKHGVAEQQIQMLYMGVSTQFLPAKQLTVRHQTDTIKLIYTGTVSKLRGRDVMLEAMKIIADKRLNLQLTIVGASADELGYCQQRIRELSLQPYVTIVGKVRGSEIPHYLAQADVAICIWQASPWNQFNPPTKLFEYLTAGLPVLASNIRTHTRYVQHGYNGLIFEYDAQSLADALVSLHHQIHELPKMQQQALQSGQQYLWPKIEPTFLASVRKAAVV